MTGRATEMLIKFAKTVILNVTKVRAIRMYDSEDKKVVKKGGFFKADEVKITTRWNVELQYVDIDGKDATQTIWHRDLQSAEKTQKELLQQIRELELENMTATLENAIGATDG